MQSIIILQVVNNTKLKHNTTAHLSKKVCFPRGYK